MFHTSNRKMSTGSENSNKKHQRNESLSLPGALGRTATRTQDAKVLYRMYAAAFAAVLYMIVMGMVAAYPSQATVDMRKPGSRFQELTLDEITWIASVPTLTSVIGTCLSGYTTHKLGRRAVLILTSPIYVLSWLLVVYAQSLAYIICGRALSGLCFGLCSVAVPAYIMEISTIETRGFILSCYQTGFTVGILVITALGYILRWSWLAVSGAVTVTLGACLLVLMPESPQWLYREGRRTEAARGLRFLRGRDVDLEAELEAASKSDRRLTFNEFLQPTFYKPTLIAILLMLFKQFCGISAIIAYTVSMFQNTQSSIDPKMSAVVVVAMQACATVASSVLMDKAGRRLLFLTSGTFVAASLIVLGTYSFLLQRGHNLANVDWIPLLCFIVYIAFYSLGFGTLPVVMASEMVYTHVRSVVLALTLVSGAIFSFIITKTFGSMVHLFGFSGLYWTYAMFTVVGTIYGWFFLPETKGRTISDINKSFN